MFTRNATQTPPSVAHCHVYVIFKELGGGGSSGAGGGGGSGRGRLDGRSVTVCGGKQRVSHVYSSASHQVELRVLGRNRNFVVNYTGEGGRAPATLGPRVRQ